MSHEPPDSALRPGDKVLHPYNRELGPGEVVECSRHRMTVRFPGSDAVLVFAAQGHPLVPLELPPGADPERWAEEFQDDVVSRLARAESDGWNAFRLRLAALELARLREADGLGSFLGGRIELFPHQLHVAERACREHPVRWLLADEVGLGKTVEACLILNHLVRTGRAERALVVAPRSLVVQWLGELYRKFHQVFVLVDAERRRDVLRERGPGFNPFEVYGHSVVALEDLVDEPALARLAAESRPHLLVVDEAHRLRRRQGTEGSPAYRAIAPITVAAPNVLLLTATPLEADAHGFFRLLELLHPERYASWEAFRSDLDAGVPLHPCTSSTTRADVGGFPPRMSRVVDLPPWPEREAQEREILSRPAEDALQRSRRAEQLEALLSEPAGHDDPRIVWLGRAAREWQAAGEKGLVFVASRPSLERLKTELEYATSRRIAVFHEDLSPARRDLEVARFAQDDGPALLLATECGGEGRNFQFATRLVLFDLPWDPVVVEQRIGRLDRINRRIPVEIVSFRPAEGFGAQVHRLHEALGLFREPLGGLERALGHVTQAIRAALDGSANLDVEVIVQETREARERVRRAVHHHVHRTRYRPELAEGILARVPEDLGRRIGTAVLEACRQFGFEMEPKGGRGRWYLEFGHEATIETLHGVPPGSRFYGTFDRDEAVRNESLDFFSSGHPLVEAILGELADGTHGRVAFLEVGGADRDADGVVVLLRVGAEFRIRAFDLDGREHPDWVDRIHPPPERAREVPGSLWGVEGWAERVGRLFAAVDWEGELAAVCGLRLRRIVVADSPVRT